MKQSEINKQLETINPSAAREIKKGVAMAGLWIAEGDISKEAVLALLDIEIKYFKEGEK